MSGRWRIALLLGALLALPRRHTPTKSSNISNSNVEVAKDGDLTVSETLRVQAENREMRHGIYRDFPLTFRDAGGTLREVTFSLLGVTRDGNAEPYHTERTHGVIRIYAGDKDVLIRPGEHTYVFRYRTGRQIRWFDGKPELNWNVTGNFWRFPILRANYRLNLAGSAGPVRWTAFTGRLGERGTDWQGELGALGTLTVSTTRPLRARRGSYRRRRAAVNRRRSAEREHAAVVRILRQPPMDHRRHRLPRRAHLLFRRLGSGRPRPEARHHHSAVPSAARASRRRSPTTSIIGASGARNGAPSPRRRCRSRCAASFRSTTTAAR